MTQSMIVDKMFIPRNIVDSYKRSIFVNTSGFLLATYAGHVVLAAVRIVKVADLLNSLFCVFSISFLLNYNLKYMIIMLSGAVV